MKIKIVVQPDGIFLVLLLLQLAENLTQGKSVTCTGGDFSKCERGYLKCLFNKNVNATKHDFNIVHYLFSHESTNDGGTYVLLCNWQASGTLECNVKDGYVFDYAVNERLTLGIPDVSPKVEGKYVCQLVPDDGVNVETCTITVRDGPPSNPPEWRGEQSGSLHPNNDNGVVIAILMIVIVILVIVAISAAIHIRSLYQRLQKKGRYNRSGVRDKHSSSSPSNAASDSASLMPGKGPEEEDTDDMSAGKAKANDSSSKPTPPGSNKQGAKAESSQSKEQREETAKKEKLVLTSSQNSGLEGSSNKIFKENPVPDIENKPSISQRLAESEKILDQLEAGSSGNSDRHKDWNENTGKKGNCNIS